MRAFITGVSSGIGLALTEQFVAAGYEVWGIARREAELKTLALKLNSKNFHYSLCDITSEVSVLKTRQRMMDCDFFPDIFVLNAAIDIEEPSPGLSANVMRDTLRTNLEGALIWINIFIEDCLERKDCQFIAVSSLLAHWPDTSSISYSASKAGLNMAFRGLRLRYQKNGIRFKIIHLGPVDTGINPRFKNAPPLKKPFWVASPKDTSRFIIRCLSQSGKSFHYPWYVLVLIRLFGWLPDRFFQAVTLDLKR